MLRSAREEREVLSAFRGWLDARPAAGMIVGTVVAGTSAEGYAVQIGHVDCCPVSLVALASELLDAASEQLRGCADPRPVLDLICAIERARVALNFTVPADPH